MGERLLCKQEVVGSIPITSTRLAAVMEFPGAPFEAPPASVVWHRESGFVVLDRRQACPGDRLFSRAGFQASARVGCPGLLNLNAVLPGGRRRPLAFVARARRVAGSSVLRAFGGCLGTERR